MQKLISKATKESLMAKLHAAKEAQERSKADGSEPKGTLISKIKCDKCNDAGGFFSYEYDEILQYEFQKWKPCECTVQNDIRKLFRSSHISEEFQEKSFDNFFLDNRPQSVRDAKYCATKYAEQFNEFRNKRKNSIYIGGRPGSGKTHLLMAIANGIINKGTAVMYFPWVEAFNNLKDDFSLLDSKIKHMQQVDVLYIDDLFKGRKEPTPFQLEQAFAVINTRYLEKKPMLISSERTIDEIISIDEALGSRLAEMCFDYTVNMIGEGLNYRLQEG
jgi:DNA replication protein DnaC